MTTKNICITDIFDGPLPCVYPTIQWIVPDGDCITSPCNGCDDDCITVTAIDECENPCVQVIVSCPSCGTCEDVVKDVCLCETEGDCSICEDCEDGICVDKCVDYCEDGACVDCAKDGHCDGDKKCIQGTCQCPPGSTEIEGNICRECLVDNDCNDCKECAGYYCREKLCGSGQCLNDVCVDCINSGHCPSSECCQEDNTCDCCQGFTRDLGSNTCIPNPTCIDSIDCPDCKECVGGECVDKVCPTGYTCYNDECVKLCNCLTPQCQEAGNECTDIGNKCVCLPCDPCEEEEEKNSGEGTDPDPTNTSNPGSPCNKNGDCGVGKFCQDGICVDCANCPDGSGGSYESCVENFVINKNDDNCQIEGILETTVNCNCDLLTWSVEVYERDGNSVSFRLRLRKGNAFVSGLNNIPLLRNIGIDNPYPSTGGVDVVVKEQGYYVEDENSVWNDVKSKGNFSYIGVDEIITEKFVLNKPGNVCVESSSGKSVKVETVLISFKIPEYSLSLENNCLYSIEPASLSYVIKSFSGNGFIGLDFYTTNNYFTRYQILDSKSSKNPTFKWYKSNNSLTVGGSLIRTAYSSKVSSNKYRDAWLGVPDNVEIQNHYRLESDCACSDYTLFECEGSPDKLYYCNPDIPSLNYNANDCNKDIEFSGNSFTVCYANDDYPQIYDLYLGDNLVDSFTPSDGILNINGVYSLATSVQTYQLKLQGIDCEDCYNEVTLGGGILLVSVNSYDCDTNELGVSVSGGSGNYSLDIDGTVWAIGDPIVLTVGTHTITVFDPVSYCEIQETFEVDCCAIFVLNAADTSVCMSTVGTYNFTVSGGEANYTWNIYDFEGGVLIDNGVSTLDSISTDLSTYSSPSFFISVTDNRGCYLEKVVYVTYLNPVDVTFSNTTYCTGDADITIQVNVLSGALPISFDLKQAAVSVQTGTITASTDNITISITGNNSFDLELTDNNGCFLDKPLTLTELTCPDPIITATPETICQGFDLIVVADITDGNAPFDWEIVYSGSPIATGTGSSINYNTTDIYSAVAGIYTFTINVIDFYNKTDTTNVDYTVLDSTDPACVVCGPAPGVNITSDVGWSVEPNDAVTITHDFGTAISQEWYIDNVLSGTNAILYPDTSAAGSYDIYVKVEYEAGCFTNSLVETLTVTIPCTCDYDISLTNGWGVDNGTIVTSSTTSTTTDCVDNIITAEAIVNSCDAGNTYEWKLSDSNGVIKTSTTNNFSHTITYADTYILKLQGVDGSCFVETTTFTKEFVVCRSCLLNSDPITNSTICDGLSVNKTLVTHDKWVNTDLRFRSTVDGSNYGTTPQKCNGLSACSHTQNFSGLSVGTHAIVMDAYEYDVGAGVCLTSQSFDITVLAPTDPVCQDCSDNTATITVVGEQNCSGGACDVIATEGQSVNLSASATGSDGGFTYQWSNYAGNVGTGSNINVGPFAYGSSNTYYIKVTDLEGCEFDKTIYIVVQRDCSGSVSATSDLSSACPAVSVTLSWTFSNIYWSTQYTIDVFRSTSGAGGPFQEVASNLAWYDSYTFSMPNSNYDYYVVATRGSGADACIKTSAKKVVTLDTCIDCTGIVDSISIVPSSICLTDTVDLTANVSGDATGWTYDWREGTSSSGTQIGTGITVSNYQPSAVPQTIRVWYSKTGCTSSYKEKIIPKSTGCCDQPFAGITVTPTSQCKGETINASGNNPVNQADWTWTWYEGQTATGTPLYTGYLLSAYVKPTWTTDYLTLKASRPGCSDYIETVSIPATAQPNVLIAGPALAYDNTCKGETVELYISNGATGGWTYDWYNNATGTGTIAQPNSATYDYEKQTTGTEYVSVRATKGNCDSLTDAYTFNPLDCCPSGITLTKICNSSNIQIRVNGLDDEYTVQFNADPVLSGPHPSGQRTYTWAGTGEFSLTIVVSHQYCYDDDPTTYNLTLVR